MMLYQFRLTETVQSITWSAGMRGRLASSRTLNILEQGILGNLLDESDKHPGVLAEFRHGAGE